MNNTMNSLDTTKNTNKLNKAVIIISKILEISHWVGCVLVIGIIGVTATGKLSLLKFLTDARVGDETLSTYGFTMEMSDLSNTEAIRAFILFFVTLLIVFALMAMVFRNTYLTFKTAEGKTKFSKGATPFQPDIIRMIREIGIFMIAIPAVEHIMLLIAQFMLGDAAEVSVQFSSIFFGLVVLAISRFFSYGAELQEDTDGLV